MFHRLSACFYSHSSAFAYMGTAPVPAFQCDPEGSIFLQVPPRSFCRPVRRLFFMLVIDWCKFSAHGDEMAKRRRTRRTRRGSPDATPTAQDRGSVISSRYFLPVLLLVGCFGAYVSNGDFLPGGDMDQNLHSYLSARSMCMYLQRCFLHSS